MVILQRFIHLYFISVTGNRIDGIKLTNNSNNIGTGIVILNFSGEWRKVCYYGYGRGWGKSSANVACRQLQFLGGWPISFGDTSPYESKEYLCNFDCNGGILYVTFVRPYDI